MNKKQYRYINDAKSSTSVSIDEVTQGFFFWGGGAGATVILLFCTYGLYKVHWGQYRPKWRSVSNSGSLIWAYAQYY